MKKKMFMVGTGVLLLVVLLSSFGFDSPRRGARGGRSAAGRAGGLEQFAAAVEKLPKESLSAEERDGLLLLREEEKLARDVYLFLGEKWEAPAFFNIAKSEQTHMDYVKLILDRYGIADPAADDARGKFTDPAIAALYSDLTAKGGVSAAEAFKVGALIEDLDIADVEKALARADNADIRILYQNLDKGSRNHLRAFHRQFAREGVAYEPAHISKDLYSKILSSRGERGGLITDPDYVF